MASHIIGKPEYIVGGKYRLVRKIGSGSFGDIYLGINITNGEVSSILSIPSQFLYLKIDLYVGLV